MNPNSEKQQQNGSFQMIPRAVFAFLKKEKRTKFEATCEVLRLLTNKPRGIEFSGVVYQLEENEGDLVLKELAKCWGWSEGSVRLLLNQLIKLGVLEKRTVGGNGLKKAFFKIKQKEEQEEAPKRKPRKKAASTATAKEVETPQVQTELDTIKKAFKGNADINEVWETWKLYKKQSKRFTYKSEQSEILSLKDLMKLSNANTDVAKLIVEQSIKKTWAGLFPLKENKTHSKNSQSKNQLFANDAARFKAEAEKYR